MSYLQFASSEQSKIEFLEAEDPYPDRFQIGECLVIYQDLPSFKDDKEIAIEFSFASKKCYNHQDDFTVEFAHWRNFGTHSRWVTFLTRNNRNLVTKREENVRIPISAVDPDSPQIGIFFKTHLNQHDSSHIFSVILGLRWW